MRGSSAIWVSESNGQLLTHSNHLGTHIDGEIHFFTPGKDIASLDLNDFLCGPAAVVDLSDATGDYQIYTAEMIEERVEVREGDILIIHTGYHHFGWDQPYADEIRYMVQHPGPDREFAEWCKEKKIEWIGVDCGSADHPMNTIIRDWMPRQAAEADKLFREMYGTTLEERFTGDKYQLMHIEMFPITLSTPNAWAATSTCCATGARPSAFSPGALSTGSRASAAAWPWSTTTSTRS
jgi:arylformamidase